MEALIVILGVLGLIAIITYLAYIDIMPTPQEPMTPERLARLLADHAVLTGGVLQRKGIRTSNYSGYIVVKYKDTKRKFWEHQNAVNYIYELLIDGAWEQNEYYS